MILSVVLGRVSGSAPSGGTGHGREPWKAACSLGSSSLPLPARCFTVPIDKFAFSATLVLVLGCVQRTERKAAHRAAFFFFAFRSLGVYRELDAVDSFTTSD